jgi:hypothetical protein
MALLHFPASLGFMHDPRTLHAGSAAIDEKWIFVTWMWMHSRTPESVLERDVPQLSPSLV